MLDMVVLRPFDGSPAMNDRWLSVEQIADHAP